MTPFSALLVSSAFLVGCVAGTASSAKARRQTGQTQTLFETAEGGILAQETGDFIEDLLRSWGSPGGIAIAVVRKDEAGEWDAETRGYGIARSDGSRVTPQTLFAIGSNTKLFNVLAAGLLIHNHSVVPQLTWDTKLASILPGFELMDPIATAHTTITDIISHRTGLPRHDLMYSFSDEMPSILAKLKYLRPSAEFRETWQYNSLMYMTLSYLPTALLPSKISFTDYVTEHILDPLGMKATTFSYDKATESNELAEGFGRQMQSMEDPFSIGKPWPFPFWSQNDRSAVSGAGGMITSAENLATWIHFLLLDGEHPKCLNKSIVPANVIRKASAGVTVVADNMGYPEFSSALYGGGQVKSSYRGHEMIGHGGAAPGKTLSSKQEAFDLWIMDKFPRGTYPPYKAGLTQRHQHRRSLTEHLYLTAMRNGVENVHPPSFRSQIARFPSDNFGIAVLSNDDTHGNELVEIIKLRVVEDILGLSPTNWNRRYRQKVLSTATRSALAAAPFAGNVTLPSIQLDRLSGNYSNPSYGSLELCPISCARATLSESCKTVISDAHMRLPEVIDSKKLTFVAKWDKVWATHLIFTHFDNNIFNVTVLMSLPTNDPNEPFWTTGDQFYRAVTTEFAEHYGTGVIGFGMMGDFWGAGPGAHSPQGETLCHRSEVLFEHA